MEYVGQLYRGFRHTLTLLVTVGLDYIIIRLNGCEALRIKGLSPGRHFILPLLLLRNFAANGIVVEPFV